MAHHILPAGAERDYELLREALSHHVTTQQQQQQHL